MFTSTPEPVDTVSIERALLKSYNFSRTRLDSAMIYANRALEFAEKQPDSLWVARAYLNLGTLEESQGNFSQAVEHLLASLRLFDKYENVAGEAEAHYKLGNVNIDLGAPELALNHLLEAKLLFGDLKDYSSLSEVLSSLGLAHARLSQHAEAVVHFDRAMFLADSLDNKPVSADVARLLASAHLAMGEYDQAQNRAERAFGLYKSLGDIEGKGEVLADLSQINLAKGNIVAAKTNALDALEESRIYGSERLEANALQKLAMVYEAEEDYTSALQSYKQYNTLKDSLTNTARNQRSEDLQQRYAAERRDILLKQYENERVIQSLRLNKQRMQIIFVVLALVLMGIFSFLLYRRNKQNVRMIAKLRKQNDEVRQQKAEMLTQAETLKKANERVQWVNQSLQHLNNVIATQKEEIEKTNGNIRASISYASRIQSTMLPSITNIRQHLAASFVFFRPRDVVSGDFYWFAHIPSRPAFKEIDHGDKIERVLLGNTNEKLILATFDCTGHGVPGALMSMTGEAQLNQIVNNDNIHRPDEILNHLHRRIRTSLKQEDSLNRDGMDGAVCVITRDGGDGDRTKPVVVEFAGAKSPLVFVRNKILNTVKGDKFPIGGMQKEKERQFTRHVIAPEFDSYGNPLPLMLFMYSDGFQDQFGGPNERKFMAPKFRELLHELSPLPVDEQEKKLGEAFDSWKGNGAQTDDVVVLGVRI